MSKRLFGTDGIRGIAGEPPLDPPTVIATGMALGEDLAQRFPGKPVLIGMDTRESGPALAAQLAQGLNESGVRTEFAGIVTTPGVAYLARTGDFAAGVMISASHNPYKDNGIKVFAHNGYKLPDAEEILVEQEIFRILDSKNDFPSPAPLAVSCSVQPYLDFLLSTLPARLDGQTVVVDCGNGAASALAPELFRAAGANVIPVCCEPNGRNINLDCGALHLNNLRVRVLETNATAGVAFDGDADRAMLIAPDGRIVDGDAILLIAARRMQADGHLPGNQVISTVMANLGLEKALSRLGIEMVRTPVGDKYVLEEMLRRNAWLGGEQSGHIIFREYATTGDGMLSALQILATCAREQSTLDRLAADLTVYPQILVNIRVRERRPLETIPRVVEEIQDCEREMDGSGRILVRYSGTEPLARVMVEGPEQGAVDRWASRIASVIRAELA
jgi:phosphoglucosamine mutase